MAKPSPAPREYHEGPEAAQRFSEVVKGVLSVSRAELEKREQAWRQARPKPKRRKVR